MELLKTIALIHIGFFAAALVLILMSNSADKKQKTLQILFSLFLVIVGPLVAIIVHVSDRLKPEKPSDRYIGQSIDESPITKHTLH